MQLKHAKIKTRPVLVALYDIRPGNGAGLYLQPRSLHGALFMCIQHTETVHVNLIPKNNAGDPVKSSQLIIQFLKTEISNRT